jgi:hypothetical protein
MGIEWFRDLSIIIMSIATSVVLIFITVLIYRLYRKANSTLQLAQSTMKVAHDALATVQQGPVAVIFSLIKGLRSGYEGISSLFKKKNNKGESKNE